jgi:hypothetical protein
MCNLFSNLKIGIKRETLTKNMKRSRDIRHKETKKTQGNLTDAL